MKLKNVTVSEKCNDFGLWSHCCHCPKASEILPTTAFVPENIVQKADSVFTVEVKEKHLPQGKKVYFRHRGKTICGGVYG